METEMNILFKRIKQRLLQHDSGFITYIAIILLLVLSIYSIIIIQSRHLSLVPIKRDIKNLQSSVLAYSGLSLAQAFIAGYDGKGVQWEAEELSFELEGVGEFSVSSFHDAGWLKVESSGIHNKDTVTLSGILGHSLPEITKNALSILQSDHNVVVGERARIFGNIGTSGGGVVNRGNGVFHGMRKNIENFTYCDSTIENEFKEIDEYFLEHRSVNYMPDSLQPVEPDQFKSALRGSKKDIYIEGNLIISDTIDCEGKTVWLAGDAVINEHADINNINIRVLKNIYVTDNAGIHFGSIFCFGDVRITSNSYVRANIMCADTLCVEDNANVLYPSVLYLSPFIYKKYSRGGQLLIIQDKAEVTGTVLTGNFGGRYSDPYLLITGRSRIEGLIFTPETLTLYGNITGSVIANRIIYRYERTVYDGWIKETLLKSRDLSEMVVPALFPAGGVPAYLIIKRV